MKCRISENDIALYVENDLPEARFWAIDAHVAACEECRELVAELRESQLGLMSLRQDAVTPAMLANVRTRVLAEISGVSSTTAWGRKLERLLFEGLRRRYVPAGLVLVLGISAIFWQTREVPEAPPDVLKPVAAVLPPAEPAPVPTVVHKKAKVRKRKVRVAEPEQMVVKLLTDDPNVVIYWLVDKTGGD